MTDPDFDEIMINLKVIGSIQVNAKLSTKGSFLNLEQPSYIPESIKRWIRNDNRDETIKKIDRIIIKSIAILHTRDEHDKLLLLRYMESAKNGILNLKETYSLCIQTSARLDTIIDKIDGISIDVSSVDFGNTVM
jgi:hypothetical protein